MIQLVAQIGLGAFWVLVIVAALLALGLPLWWGFTGRRPRPAELCGPVFVLGCAVLVVLSAALITVRQAQPGPAAGTLAAGVLAAWVVSRAHAAENRSALGDTLSSLRKSIGAAPLWWGAFGALAGVEFLVALAPNTAWDAYNLHYGIVEKFWRGGTFVPMGMAPSEYQHLNTQALYTLWMTVGGERAANLFSLVQVLSLAATVYLGVRRYAEPFWARLAALMVAALPVTVHQSTGGWVDTLLIQSILLAYLCYAADEARPIGWALMAGLCGGFAWGVKQSAPALLLPLALLAACDFLRFPARRVPVLALGAMLIAAAAPWVLRTWTLTGNPLYPAFPSLTRLPESFDMSEAVGRRSPLPFGFFEMFLVHSGAASGLKGAVEKWLDDGIPVWILAYLLLGSGAAAARRQALGGLGRFWVVALLAFGPTYLFFFGNPRYGLFAYVLAIVCVTATLGAAMGEVKPLRWLCGGLAALSFLLGLGIAGGKLWKRRDVLLARVSAESYVASVHPHVGLLQKVRPEIAAGEAVVVFNGLSYRNGMPTYDADPRLPGARVVNWSSRSRDEVLANLRELHVRWIVVPFGHGKFAQGTALWASRQSREGESDPARLRDTLAREFPEWQWKESTALWVDPSVDRFARVVERLHELRPWLEPKGTAPGWALYRVRDVPAAMVPPAGNPLRPAGISG